MKAYKDKTATSLVRGFNKEQFFLMIITIILVLGSAFVWIPADAEHEIGVVGCLLEYILCLVLGSIFELYMLTWMNRDIHFILNRQKDILKYEQIAELLYLKSKWNNKKIWYLNWITAVRHKGEYEKALQMLQSFSLAETRNVTSHISYWLNMSYCRLMTGNEEAFEETVIRLQTLRDITGTKKDREGIDNHICKLKGLQLFYHENFSEALKIEREVLQKTESLLEREEIANIMKQIEEAMLNRGQVPDNKETLDLEIQNCLNQPVPKAPKYRWLRRLILIIATIVALMLWKETVNKYVLQENIEDTEMVSETFFFSPDTEVQKVVVSSTIPDLPDQKTDLLVTNLASYPNGKLYELRLDYSNEFSCEDWYEPEWDRRHLGYFYVEGNTIYRIKEYEADEFNTCSEEALKSKGTIVCQESSVEDRLGAEEKGFHEIIDVDGNICTYKSYYNNVETDFFEGFIWEKGKGLVEYYSGYGAQSFYLDIKPLGAE